MAVDAAQFRVDFPEFTSTTVFPDAQVNLWLGVGYKLVLEPIWCDMHDMGVELFAAHNLSLEATAQKQAAAGGGVGVPGTTSGALASKTVDKVSVSYDNAATTELDAGHWNLTIYGKRFIRLARLFGARPLQIGIGIAPPYTVGAWPGPPVLG